MNAIVSTACPACEQAKQNPLTGRYQAACFQCNARSIANSPAFFDAQRLAAAGKPMTAEYRELLQRAFDGAWKAGHEAAKWWYGRMHGSCK